MTNGLLPKELPEVRQIHSADKDGSVVVEFVNDPGTCWRVRAIEREGQPSWLLLEKISTN